MYPEFLPECATDRSVGTVILSRVQRKVGNFISRTMDGSDAATINKCTENLSTLAQCKQCDSHSSNSHYYSDCSSDKHTQKRLTGFRLRKYVNVYCSAVCLVLFIGSLCPQSSAAPLTRRSMDKKPKRISDENPLWGNPCDLDQIDSPTPTFAYEPRHARELAQAANAAMREAEEYKDKFALSLHSVADFNQLVKMWGDQSYVRNIPWITEDILPKEKVLYKPMPQEYINKLVESDKIVEIMPAMFKTLKLFVGVMDKVYKITGSDYVTRNEQLRTSVKDSIFAVRQVLCRLNNILKSLNVTRYALKETEIPEFNDETKTIMALLAYRDMLNFLEYIGQIFQTIHDTGKTFKLQSSA